MTRYSLNGIETRMVLRHRCTINIRKNDKRLTTRAELVAKRSTCLRRHVGAVIVKDKRILATGYNGAPSGTTHCEDIGCLREKLNIPAGERHEICRGIHAEQNAIIQASTCGVNISGAIIYTTR